jgi:hypothetical protein
MKVRNVPGSVSDGIFQLYEALPLESVVVYIGIA